MNGWMDEQMKFIFWSPAKYQRAKYQGAILCSICLLECGPSTLWADIILSLVLLIFDFPKPPGEYVPLSSQETD